MKRILFLALLVFSATTHAQSELTQKAEAQLKMGMAIEQVIELLEPATWAVKKGDEGEFALEPGIELTLRWNNTPYTPIAIDFNQAQKVIGWDLGKMKNEAMAALMAQGLADYSCQKADRNKLCGVSSVSGGDGLFSFTVNAVPSNSTIKIMNIGPKYKPGIRLKPGKYDVLVQHSGYKKYRKWITLDSDMTLDVELQSPYSCDTKYCKNMTSCDEAKYKLNVCGHGRLDRDGDGIPCENVCGR